MEPWIYYLTTGYLFLFSLYHIITGIISVFFSDFALKFYKSIYGFQPKETKQLKMTFKPWGNLALVMGIVGFIVFFDLERFSPILFAFSTLLLIRVWYRIVLRAQLYQELGIQKSQNWRMIIIQIIGVVLFLWFAITIA